MIQLGEYWLTVVGTLVENQRLMYFCVCIYIYPSGKLAGANYRGANLFVQHFCTHTHTRKVSLHQQLLCFCLVKRFIYLLLFLRFYLLANYVVMKMFPKHICI